MSDRPSPDQAAPILFVGAGAVGGYIAAHLHKLGQRVTVLEPWAPNRDAIRAAGMTVEEPSGRFTARLPVIGALAELGGQHPGLAILCTKLADAPATVAALEAVYRGPYLVTLNALADLDLAAELGAERVMGCIVTGLFAHLVRPAQLQRHRHRLQGGGATFRLGEVSGPPTPRLRAVVALLGQIDEAEAVADLARARWTKLVFNCMTSPLSALYGCPIRDLFLDPKLRAEMLEVALEVVRIASAAGVSLDPICGISGSAWLGAARREPAALAAMAEGLARYGAKLDPAALSGMAQDRGRGRRTEVGLINGAVARRAGQLGLAAPINASLVARLEAASGMPAA